MYLDVQGKTKSVLFVTVTSAVTLMFSFDFLYVRTYDDLFRVLFFVSLFFRMRRAQISRARSLWIRALQ